ncbi:tetratricopeptide (TPR) repeat protein [Stenotrophomonas sp. AN71]|uniref:NfrA family protein n=1 Tax=Stenotrophomonas sp. AN71 TaxID=3156253 RepID=UPI003D1DBE03
MKTTLLSTVIALALASVVAPVQAQADAPLPLSGAAYRIAGQAFAAYERGDYRAAYQQSSEAIRLRPDVVRLRLLQIYALQKLGRSDEAQQQARRALDAGLRDPALPVLASAPAASGAAAAGGARAPAAARQTAAERAYQAAFALATEAYTAYNNDQMSVAASKAEQAFRQQPQQGAWAMLWVASLEAQQQLEQADAAAATALQLGAPNVADLRAKRVALGRQRAVKPAQDGYQALIAQDFTAAVGFAREAVERAPDVASHRLLLMTALELDGQLPEAERTADQALGNDADDTVARVMRAYLRQRQGNSADANADFDAALKQDWLDAQQQRNVRLLAVDAAIAAGDRERATALLAPLQTDTLTDEDEAARSTIRQAIAQRSKAIRAARAGQALTRLSYPAPIQQCRDTPYGTQCELVPTDLQGEGGAAQRAYAAYGRQDYAQAIADARQAVQESPDNAGLQGLLTTTLASGNRSQQAEARQRLDRALAEHPQDAGLLMQRGYLQQRAGDPLRALDDFRSAEATGKAPPTVVMDQAYAAAASGDNRQAARLLRGAIDKADAGTLPLDTAQRYNTRSAIASYEREWGVTLAAGYRGANQSATNLGGAAISTPGASVFGTLEAFWRPQATHNQHGTLELYARLADTLYDEGGTYESIFSVDPCTGAQTPDSRALADRLSRSRSVAGWPSTIGSFGVRYAFGQTGLSVGLERRQFLGSATRRGGIYADSAAVRCRIQLESERPLQVNTLARYRLDSNAGGWMTYATYGFYHGTGVRTDVNQWWYYSGYMQAGYTWDDNRARFTVDALDANGNPGQRLVESSGRLRRQQAFAAAELRAGRSYRFGAEQTRWVVTPYVVVGADWLDQRSRVSGIDYPLIGSQSFLLSDTARSWSLGTGPGVGVRYWFREDHYNAARSYLDLTVQYRFALGGGDRQRAQGLFATAILYY